MAESLSTKRVASIDILRGFCIFWMIVQTWFLAFESSFGNFAVLFAHEEDGLQILRGVSLADLGAPLFIFIIGLTIVGSWNSKTKKYGQDKASYMMYARYLTIVGIGALITGFDKIFNTMGKYVALEEKNHEALMKLINRYWNAKVFMICFLVSLVLLLIMFIAKKTKKEKAFSLMSSVFKYYLIVLGLFTIYSIFAYTGEDIFKHYSKDSLSWSIGTKVWDTLENIGFAGLIALPFVRLSKKERIATVCFVYITWSALCNHSSMELVSLVVEGGAIAAPCWASILILGSVFYDYHINQENKKYWILTGSLLVFALAGVYLFNFPAGKRGCSPVYAAFTTSVSALFFKLFTLLKDNNVVTSFLKMLGRNALVLYTANYALSIVACFVFESLEFEPSVAVGCLIVVCAVTVLSLIIYPLNKEEKYVRV